MFMCVNVKCGNTMTYNRREAIHRCPSCGRGVHEVSKDEITRITRSKEAYLFNDEEGVYDKVMQDKRDKLEKERIRKESAPYKIITAGGAGLGIMIAIVLTILLFLVPILLFGILGILVWFVSYGFSRAIWKGLLGKPSN